MQPTTEETPIQEIDNYGDIRYTLNGVLHRTDGPASIEADGSEEWFLNGKCHRTTGPAYIGANGTEEWYIDNKLHRTDGPAYINADGTQIWYLSNVPYSFKEFCQKLNLPSEDILFLKLKYKE